jgi:hypothetical protein
MQAPDGGPFGQSWLSKGRFLLMPPSVPPSRIAVRAFTRFVKSYFRDCPRDERGHCCREMRRTDQDGQAGEATLPSRLYLRRLRSRHRPRKYRAVWSGCRQSTRAQHHERQRSTLAV